MQQIIISGLGGQGVIFITRLLAEGAVKMNRSVLISETHGMAQRGGNVISHLKVGARDGGQPLISPLIRPGHADILLALHAEALLVHGHFPAPDGVVFCNGREPSAPYYVLNADHIANGLQSPVSANLVLLGFAAASGKLFCGPEEIEAALNAMGGKRLEISLRAFRAGCEALPAASTAR